MKRPRASKKAAQHHEIISGESGGIKRHNIGGARRRHRRAAKHGRLAAANIGARKSRNRSETSSSGINGSSSGVNIQQLASSAYQQRQRMKNKRNNHLEIKAISIIKKRSATTVAKTWHENGGAKIKAAASAAAWRVAASAAHQ